MKSQSSVGKTIIWAVSMVVLCTFLTFFMSMFIGSAFPNMNIIYKGGIPVIVFVVLGIISFGIQEYLLPFIDDFTVPDWVKNALPIVLIGAGVLLMQFNYDENSGSAAVAEIYQNFAVNGQFYEASGLGIKSIYQYGLDISCVLFGYTVFAVSLYNRIYVVLSAVFIYLALKKFTRSTFSSVLFFVFFLFGPQILQLGVMPDASVVYLLLCSFFVYILSLVFYYRTRKKNVAAIIITQILAVACFAFLLVCEPNSIILVLPLIAVFFSGYSKQETRVYFLSSIVSTLLVIIGLVAAVVTNPMLLLQYSFDLPAYQTFSYDVTLLLILALIGFMGVYGMWKRRIHYILPAFACIYFMFAERDFMSGITSDLSLFLSFAVFAALGMEALNTVWEDEDDEEEIPKEKAVAEETPVEVPPVNQAPVNKTPVNTTPVNTNSVNKTVPTQVAPVEIKKEEMEEINAIKAMNEKLNQVDAGFVPMTFKKPKRQEKKSIDYAYEPTPAEMKYDIEVAENDDFDI